jgi:dipeptidase
VVVPETGPVWFAKNSNREPSEAQFIECHDGSVAAAVPDGLPETRSNARLLLSRPAWMWGAEIGINEHGLAMGNEAVFTRLPVPKAGYTGMDFLRAALAACRTADDALEQMIELTERLTQGGPMGHRNRSFRYNSSFAIADATTAWIFETAGSYWAAKRVRGVATISNALSIEDDFDRVHGGAYELARKRGWVKSAGDFRFASAFSAPCAHASWFPTRHAQQTTSSIIARLDPSGPTVWATGTSSPCLSVFKPTPFDPQLLPPRPIADTRFDERELWWAHERLHRACLADYQRRRLAFAEDRERFQDNCLQSTADPEQAWNEHRSRVDDWLGRVLEVRASRGPLPTRWYWSRQSRAVSIPV